MTFWIQRWNSIFGSRRRDGTLDGALWHRRSKIEFRLGQLLSARSQNICIDGPTGSGKSSLAITVFSQIRQPYIWVPVVNDMQWPDFCEEVALRSLRARGKMRKGDYRGLTVKVDSNNHLTGEEFANPLKLLGRVNSMLVDRWMKA